MNLEDPTTWPIRQGLPPGCYPVISVGWYIDRLIDMVEERFKNWGFLPLTRHEYLVMIELANRCFGSNEVSCPENALWETPWVLVDASLMFRGLAWEDFK